MNHVASGKAVPARSVTHATFVIERAFSAAPEHVFAAFADPARKRRWFAEGEGFQVDECLMDFRVGGSEHARFRFSEGSPVPASTMENETVYLDIVPGRRIVIAYVMILDGKRISASLATFEILSADQGTRLIFTEQAAFFEGADGAKLREQGWREL